MALAKKGVRSKEIGLKMQFVGNNKLAADAFQKVKNKIYFSLDKRNESVNEASLGDKIMRFLFYNSDAQVPRKLNTYSMINAFPASDPKEYKKAVLKMKDVELTNYWDTVRRKKYTFNKNQEFMKKLIKIEMEKRKLKMLPDLGK
jgi:hypothetical protein